MKREKELPANEGNPLTSIRWNNSFLLFCRLFPLSLGSLSGFFCKRGRGLLQAPWTLHTCAASVQLQHLLHIDSNHCGSEKIRKERKKKGSFSAPSPPNYELFYFIFP